MIYLTYVELLYVGERALGAQPVVRDAGLLEAAVGRPRTTVFGEDAYTWLESKAAALVHSIARNLGLVDGNKRLALAALIAFFGVNGERLSLTNDEAYDLIIEVATGALDDVEAIAARICTRTPTPVPRSGPGR